MEPPDKTTTMTNEQLGCRLLSIPAEIRNEIYRLSFKTDGGFVRLDGITPFYNPFHFGKRFKVPALLRTCRQIRSEAAGLFFAETKFRCRSAAGSFVSCIETIDKDHIKFFRCIEFRSTEGRSGPMLWLNTASLMLAEDTQLFKDGVIRAGYCDPPQKPLKESCMSWISMTDFLAEIEEQKVAWEEAKRKKRERKKCK